VDIKKLLFCFQTLRNILSKSLFSFSNCTSIVFFETKVARKSEIRKYKEISKIFRNVDELCAKVHSQLDSRWRRT